MPALNYLFASFAVSGFIAVAAGAFGAHALTPMFSAKALGWWQTAVQYQFFHTGLGLVLCLAQNLEMVNTAAKARLKIAALLALLGIVLFSGSLYIMALSGITKLGMVTPIGGLCFLLAWALSAWQFAQINSK